MSHAELDVEAVNKLTWWTPKEIPQLARRIKNKRRFDLLVVFSASHGTVRCIRAIVELFKLPAIIWALPTRYSLATSGLAASYLKERGYWARLLCNDADDPSIREQVEKIARASRALRQSKQASIGVIGRLSPLMISLPYNLKLLRRRLGVQAKEISLDSLRRILQSIPKDQVETAVSLYEKKYSVRVSGEALSKAVRFQLAVRKIIESHRLDGIALECWTRLFPKYGINPCLGHLDDLTVGCEGDVVSLAGSIILKSINGVNPYLADVLGVDTKANTVTLSHCSAPISLAKEESKVEIVERTDPKSVGKTAFAHFEFKNGPVTLVRFYGRDLGRMHMTWGELQGTGDFWGGIELKVRLNGDATGFLNNLSGNHYLLTYGDVREELRLIAEWKKLELKED